MNSAPPVLYLDTADYSQFADVEAGKGGDAVAINWGQIPFSVEAYEPVVQQESLLTPAGWGCGPWGRAAARRSASCMTMEHIAAATFLYCACRTDHSVALVKLATDRSRPYRGRLHITWTELLTGTLRARVDT